MSVWGVTEIGLIIDHSIAIVALCKDKSGRSDEKRDKEQRLTRRESEEKRGQ